MAAAIARTSFVVRVARIVLLSLAAGAGIIAACDVETRNRIEPSPVPVLDASAGALIVQWTVEGVNVPSECDARNAAFLSLTVTGSNDQVFDVFQEDCRAFTANITLPAGTYEADAVLIDGQGNAVSQTAHIDHFTLVGNDEALRIIDLEPISAE